MFKLLEIRDRTHNCEICHCSGAKYEFTNPFTSEKHFICNMCALMNIAKTLEEKIKND